MATYTVVRGDTLNSIAAKARTTALALYSLNAAGIGPFTTRPRPGLVLTLPSATEEGAPAPDTQTPPAPPWPTSDVGFANPMTAPGDLIVGGTAGAPANLAKGDDGQVLTTDPDTHLPAWDDPVVPTLAEVLTAGNDVGSTAVAGAGGELSVEGAGYAGIRGKAGTSAVAGATSFVAAGDDAHSGTGAKFIAAGGDGSGIHGRASIKTDGVFSTAGKVPVGAEEGDGSFRWQDLVAVVHTAPTTYAGPLVFDDSATTGGLYAWVGSSYTKIGPATS
jgi:hypothetical protein